MIDSIVQLGRPIEYLNYVTPSTTAFTEMLRVKGVGPTLTNTVLRGIKHPLFDINQLAPSAYLLEQVEKAIIPTTVCVLI